MSSQGARPVGVSMWVSRVQLVGQSIGGITTISCEGLDEWIVVRFGLIRCLSTFPPPDDSSLDSCVRFGENEIGSGAVSVTIPSVLH